MKSHLGTELAGSFTCPGANRAIKVYLSLEVKFSNKHGGSCRINWHSIFPELEHDRTHLNRMAPHLSLARFARNDFERLLLRTLLKLFGASMAIGSFVGLVCFSRAFEDELPDIAMLAGLTAGAFPAWHGARLSPV